ncbi:MAG: DNA-directed RNA polymerase subunit alpha C-terminal domain-containing protein [Planctomycetota bacterium]|nr:DNA-directed RNA polymerase subunit alpha C-terminal domain-containing protein [Planctomycetota bacterium]
MAINPMDIIIGAGEAVQGDAQACARHMEAADRARQAGDRVAMVAELRRAVHADPTNMGAAFSLAYELDLAGEENEAMSLYERCCEATPAPINALINLAIMYEDAGDYARSEKCLRQVLDTDPVHERARLYMKDVQASREMFIDEEHDRDVAKRNALLDTPVTDFELSVRARNCLKKMNIRTLGDLLRITEAELMAYKNFGEASLLEIKNMLASKSLRLGQGLEDQHRRVRKEVFDSLKGSGGEAVLNKPVSDLKLSVRARKALQVLGIMTLGDLASRTEAELMGVKNFGATSLDEVKQRLSEHGLKLRRLEF